MKRERQLRATEEKKTQSSAERRRRRKKKHAFRVEEPKMWRMNKLSLSAAEHTAQKCN